MFSVSKKELSQVVSLISLIIFLLGMLFAKPASTSLPPPTAAPVPTVIPSPTPEVLSAASSSAQQYVVTKVVDGDTIKVNLDGIIETIRLVGINTPESVDPRVPVECMAAEASSFLTQLVGNKLVSLEADVTQSDRDHYGRLLRFVFLENGIDVGLLLIAEGYAQESLYSSKPHLYRELYLQAQQQAQLLQKGLWNPSSCPVGVLQ